MRSDIKTRFGKTRGTPEHFFRVQVTRDGAQSFTDALVMKRDDRDGPDRNSTPYRVEWAATKELEQEVEAALSRLEKRYSAKHTRNELRKILKGVPRHYVPPDAEIPIDLGVRIANAPVGLGVHAGTEPNDWEQQADTAARRRAAIADRANDLPGKDHLLGLVRSRFPGWLGFRDPRFDGGRYDEVKYKLATAEKAKELLSEQALRGLIDDGDHGEMIERLQTIARHSTILTTQFRDGDLALLNHDDLDHRRFCGAFLNLLYGDSDTPQRLDRYSDQIRSMGLRPNVNRWAMPTYFLFFLYPDEEVLIKPRTVRKLLELGGWGGRLGVEPSGEEYARVRTAYSELREALEEHGPQHMIDVQGFAWVAVQEADERSKAIKQARDAGHAQDPRIELAMAEFEQEADAHDLIERQRLLDHAQGGFKEPFGTAAKIESFSSDDFFGFFNELDTHGGKTPGLFSPSVAFPKNRDTQAYRDFEQDLPVFRKALVSLLHGPGTDAERIDRMWEIGSGVRRYITESLPIPSALLFLQDPAKWSGVLHMATKEKRLALAGIAPAVAEEASRGDRLVALERALIELPPKYGRKHWDPMALAAFYFSPAYERRLGDSPVAKHSPEPRSLPSLIQSLRNRGLRFRRETVANYIFALQTKRFAILTGISGTGKTKIARALAQHFGPVLKRSVARPPDDAVGIDVKPYTERFSRLLLPVAISNHLTIDTTTDPGRGPRIWVRYPSGRIRLSSYLAQGRHPMLYFRGDFREWFHANLKEGDQFWLRVRPGEEDEPDELELGLPDTEIVEERIHNYEVVPVRPDWVDNRGLLGYLNPLTNEYSTTPFLNLLLRAHNEEKRAAGAGEKPHPFFVILDEMNLARVEHYFSDFLSALESGEDIPLHENEAIESGESESGPQVPRRLKVPGNVLFTGTVNVDETTYMFSPKVLDRAFTIEFDQVDLEGFAKYEPSDEAPGLNLDGIQGSLDLLPSGRSDDDDWKPSREDWVTFREKSGKHHNALLQLHGILERQHRHFGYRVANEIARFVNLAREQAAEADTDAAVDAAFDLALLQKVLPKFHGTQQELESLLEEIFQFAVHGGGHAPKKNQTVELDDWKVVKSRLVGRPKTAAPSQTPSGDAVTEGDEADSDNPEATDTGTESPAYPRTGAKVLRMLNRLRDRGFTSFIE